MINIILYMMINSTIKCKKRDPFLTILLPKESLTRALIRCRNEIQMYRKKVAVHTWNVSPDVARDSCKEKKTNIAHNRPFWIVDSWAETEFSSKNSAQLSAKKSKITIHD